MITAEEYFKPFRDENGNYGYRDIENHLREFAKLHVKEALITSHKNNQLPIEDLNFTLSCYPLTNIK